MRRSGFGHFSQKGPFHKSRTYSATDPQVMLKIRNSEKRRNQNRSTKKNSPQKNRTVNNERNKNDLISRVKVLESDVKQILDHLKLSHINSNL